MNIIISIIFWINCVLITCVLFVVQVALLLFPFIPQRRLIHRQCFWWAGAIIGMNPFWKLEVSGLENIDPKQTYVMVANHQSIFDIVVLFRMKADFKWVSKESLFRIPIFGWCMSLCQYIRLRRGDGSSIKKAYREAAENLRKNMSVMFFPEGTRSDTKDMRQFQNGAFKLAIKEKRPILPISINGTINAIPKGSWIAKKKAFCRLTVLPSISTEKLQIKDFSALNEQVYNKLFNQLNSGH